jgi:hypothetical protein
MSNKNLLILAIVGLIGGALALAGFAIWNGDQDVLVTYSENDPVQIPNVYSPAIVFQNITLHDSTVFNQATNTCTGFRHGMNTTIFPCVTQDVDGKDIQQFVDFKWQGIEDLNVTWIFVYEGELESGRMDLLQNVTHTETQLVNTWVSNHLVDRIVSYADLGSPSSACQIGNTNNTQMFNVTRSTQNSTIYSQIYCFTESTPVNATAFRISGNANLPTEVEVTEPEWVDITQNIRYLGYGLLNDNRSYYEVQNVHFHPGQTYKTRWTYTAEDKELAGKWHILGYQTSTGLVQSIVNDEYIYLDPWWDNNWATKKEITVVGGASTLTNFTVFINVSYEAGMQTDFDDIRFVDSTETTELYHELDNKVNGVVAGFWVTIPSLVPGNNTIYMYYDNPVATSASNPALTWSNWDAVLHFSGNSADSSPYSQNWTNNGGITFPGTGVFGNSSSYSGSQYLSLGSAPSQLQFGTGDFTFLVWLKTSDTNFDFYCNRQDGSGSGTGTICFPNGNNGGSAGQWGFYKSSNPAVIAQSRVDDNLWRMQTFTKSGTILSSYMNSTLDKSGAISNNDYGTSSFDVQIAGVDTIGTFTGQFDEIRIRRNAVSSDWIAREYQNANASTIIIGSPEANSGVSTFLNLPIDNYIQYSTTVNFSVNSTSLESTNLTNVTFYIWNASSGDQLATNFSTISGNFSQSSFIHVLGDGIYLWNALTQGDDVTSAWGASNRTLTIDTTPPVVTIFEPQNNQLFLAESFPYNVTLNVTSSDLHLDSCWYHTSDNPTNVSYTCNTTTNVPFSSYGNKIIYVSANDTLGTTTTETASIAIATYTQIGDATGVEGSSSTFTLAVNMTNIPATTATFRYNNTNYVPTTQTNLQNATVFTYNLLIPDGYGSPAGITQYWNWTFNISSLLTNQVTPTQTQTVYAVDFDDCGTYPILAYNLTLYDEETRSLINASAGANIQVDFTWTSNAGVDFQASFENDNNNTLLVCVPANVLNQTTYSVDLVAEYSSTDRVTEFYYINNGTVNETTIPDEIKLYDLAVDDSTTFLFTFLDENGLKVPGVIVETLRYYVGEGVFTEVERSREDNNGETHIHLVEEDVIYRFRITLENQEIFLSDQYNAKCLSTPCSITLSAEPETEDFPTVYNNLPEGSFQVSANRDTREVTLLFNLNSTASMNLTVFTSNNNEVEAVASGTTTASSSSVIVTVPLQYRNATYYATVYHNGDFVATRVVDLSESANDYFGALGLLLGALAVLCLALIGASHGEWVIVWTILGLVTASTMFLVDLPWYSLMTFVAGAGIFLMKLVSRRRVV